MGKGSGPAQNDLSGLVALMAAHDISCIEVDKFYRVVKITYVDKECQVRVEKQHIDELDPQNISVVPDYEPPRDYKTIYDDPDLWVGTGKKPQFPDEG